MSFESVYDRERRLMHPLHTWPTTTKLKFVGYPAPAIEPVEVETWTDLECIVLGCRCRQSRVVKIVMPMPLGSHCIQFGACDACVHHVIMPFCWVERKNMDLMVDGIYQFPYIAEGI